jgi:hypothetical protein
MQSIDSFLNFIEIVLKKYNINKYKKFWDVKNQDAEILIFIQ